MSCFTGPSVTASLHGDFLDSASVGELIEATGEVVRAGGSFSGLPSRSKAIKTGDRTLLSFSGIVKKVRRKV